MDKIYHCGAILSAMLLGHCLTIRPAQAATIGGWDVARGGVSSIADSPATTTLRSLIQFQFPGSSFSSTNTLTSAYLSTVDVLLLGGQTDETDFVTGLSTAEQQSLFQFVAHGGGLFLDLENDEQGGLGGAAARETFVAPFGISITGTLSENSATVVDVSHPIINGPFGQVSNSLHLNLTAYFDQLGPYATTIATEDSLGGSILAGIAPGAIAPGSGAVIILADSNLLDPQPYVPVLVGNTMHYLLGVPEPSSIALSTVGLISVLAMAFRRQRRPRPTLLSD